MTKQSEKTMLFVSAMIIGFICFVVAVDVYALFAMHKSVGTLCIFPGGSCGAENIILVWVAILSIVTSIFGFIMCLFIWTLGWREK